MLTQQSCNCLELRNHERERRDSWRINLLLRLVTRSTSEPNPSREHWRVYGDDARCAHCLTTSHPSEIKATLLAASLIPSPLAPLDDPSQERHDPITRPSFGSHHSMRGQNRRSDHDVWILPIPHKHREDPCCSTPRCDEDPEDCRCWRLSVPSHEPDGVNGWTLRGNGLHLFFPCKLNDRCHCLSKKV